MSFFGSLKEIVSGRRYHKNITNNVVIRDLWNRARSLPAFEKQIFENFILAADIATDKLFFSSNRPKGIDPKKYNLEQFRLFYDSILTFCAFIAGLQAPRKRTEEINVALSSIVSNWEHAKKLHQKLLQQDKADSHTAGIVWSHIIETAHIREPDVVQFTLFAMLSLECFQATMSKA